MHSRQGTEPIDLQKAILGITEETIKANIYKIYYQLVLSKTQIELLDANIERLQKLNHDVTVMFDNGFTEKVDIDNDVQVANLQDRKTEAQNMIRNGYAGLKLLMGMPVKGRSIYCRQATDEQIKGAAEKQMIRNF